MADETTRPTTAELIAWAERMSASFTMSEYSAVLADLRELLRLRAAVARLDAETARVAADDLAGMESDWEGEGNLTAMRTCRELASALTHYAEALDGTA